MKLAEANKAVMAGATALAGMEGLAAMLEQSVTQPWIHGAIVAFSAIVGGATWLVRNKQTFDQIVDALDTDPVLEEKVATAVVEKAIEVAPAAVVEKVIEAAPDSVEDMLAKYRSRNK